MKKVISWRGFFIDGITMLGVFLLVGHSDSLVYNVSQVFYRVSLCACTVKTPAN